MSTFRHPRASRAEPVVALRGNRATAVPTFIQFSRIAHAGRSGPSGADSCSTVPAGFDCFRKMPVHAGLD
ncbi:hypothetical protein FCJ57_36270 [Burkholderia diffusa]|nr:hypothetical protein [Burkholderia diffusa]